jgi:membrane-associated phospholipid phosphatase
MNRTSRSWPAFMAAPPQLTRKPVNIRITSAVIYVIAALIALLVIAGWSQPIDDAAYNAALSVRTPWISALALILSVTFSPKVTILIGLVLGPVLGLWGKNIWLCAYVWFSIAVAAGITWIAKHIIERERPPEATRLVVDTSYSFPSGHSTAVASLLVAVAIVMSVLAPRLRALVWILAALIILTVIVSRVYAGMHWLTDIAAGACVGAATAALLATVVHWITYFELPPEHKKATPTLN